MNQGYNYNTIPEISLEKIVDKIDAFRKEAICMAKEHNSSTNTQTFYKVLQKYCYFHKDDTDSSAIFLDIIFYLGNKLFKYLKSQEVDVSHHTFWFNYNPRYFSNEELGRIVNEKELAYRLCREGDNKSSYDIIDFQNKDDYNVYYFRRIIGEGSKIEGVSENIISIQQILCNHKDIELIKVYRDADEISWKIKKYGNDKMFSLEDVSLFNINEQFYYSLFLKKTFDIDVNESEIPQYLKQSPDEFKKDDAKYTPIFLYMCNISAPFSSTNNFSGSIMFSSDTDFDPILLSKEIDHIKSIVELITDIEVQYLSIRNKELTLQESVKSAISAIMSRNMSHNLGSHYLYYTKSHLDKVASDFLNYGDNTSQFAPDIRGAARVLGYVQGRMDYLATVISQDKYPYGSINFKTHIWDELTIDDFSARHFSDVSDINKRTTNYLLSNLVQSENFTRPDVRNGDYSLDNYLLYLNVKYSNKKDKKGQDLYSRFTGLLKFKQQEDEVKKELSQLYIALPGGTMSCHAFFNIVENFIRNSAKYLQSDFKSTVNKQGISQTKLIFTIAIRRNPDNNDFFDFIIYDNKNNANRIVDEIHMRSLYTSIVQHTLGEIKIIDKIGHIEKESKGFKEMLFSALWMHAYNFEEKSFAEIIAEINEIDVADEKDEAKRELLREQKLNLIEKYAFKMVQVIDDKDKTNLIVLDRNNISKYSGKDFDKASLGLVLTIPEFKQEGQFVPQKDKEITKQKLLNIYADIINVPKEFEFYNPQKEYSGLFPRAFSGDKNLDLIDKFKSILYRRFGNFDEYCLNFDEGVLGPDDVAISKRIRFKRHLSSKDKGYLMERFKDYAYADTISGGNFTLTIEQLCNEGWNGTSFDESTRFFALKVMESALTRITIIDERLYNSNALGHEDELSLKNIRVLNYNTFEDKLADVLKYSQTLLFNGVKSNELKPKTISKLKGAIEKALEEAIFSVRHIEQTTISEPEVEECKKGLTTGIEKIITDTIDSLRNTIEACKLIPEDEKRLVSFNENIAQFVKTMHGPEIENSAALRALIAPTIEKIKDKIVNEVNYYAKGDISCILQGNAFRDNNDDTLFLSIHLGLVEKMLKNSEWLNKEISYRLSLQEKGANPARKNLEVYNRLEDNRVRMFMEIIREKFSYHMADSGRKEIYISIHSGRGNFSKELENSLKEYPFITLSALENAFNNCKYLLSQLFYNTVYLGKGIANEK